MLLPIADYLQMNAEREFRDRHNPYSPSGASIGIVRVEPRPRHHHWDFHVLPGNWKVRATFTTEGELPREESYSIKDWKVISTSTEAAVALEISLPAKLDLIRSQFGISTKDLAEALNVERPTVYAWQKEGGSKPQERHRDRIEVLVELAKYWKNLSERPLSKSIFEPMNNGRSVMDMLKAEEVQTSDVKAALRQWAEDHEARRTLLQQKAAEQRESMEKRGIKPLPDHVVDQTLRDFAKTSI